MFAMYSYIAPTITEVAKQPESVVPLFLLVFGIGGVVGTWVAGRLADWSVLRTLTLGMAATTVLLAVFTVAIHNVVTGLLVLLLISIATSLFVLSLQLRLMAVAGAAETLGAASTHSALNFANALGAWLGGIVIDRGLGFLAPSWVGVGLSLGGLAFLWLSLRVHVRDRWV
jgi:DHA1 family inner membrane transport protein